MACDLPDVIMQKQKNDSSRIYNGKYHATIIMSLMRILFMLKESKTWLFFLLKTLSTGNIPLWVVCSMRASFVVVMKAIEFAFFSWIFSLKKSIFNSIFKKFNINCVIHVHSLAINNFRPILSSFWKFWIWNHSIFQPRTSLHKVRLLYACHRKRNMYWSVLSLKVIIKSLQRLVLSKIIDSSNAFQLPSTKAALLKFDWMHVCG